MKNDPEKKGGKKGTGTNFHEEIRACPLFFRILLQLLRRNKSMQVDRNEGVTRSKVWLKSGIHMVIGGTLDP
jgi:hypothetical protein